MSRPAYPVRQESSGGTEITGAAGVSRQGWRWPLFGTLIAIAVSAAMDAVGISNFNVLPLIPLFFALWYLQHFSRADIGLVPGRWRDYALALAYPVVVLALIGLIAWIGGATSKTAVDWGKTLASLVVEIVVTSVFAIVTEEGIFRGWLWASLRRVGMTDMRVFLLTSVAFAAWHLPDVLLPTDFRPAAAQAPVYIANVVVIGFVWALMRHWSGSIVVTSVSHGVWNGLAYVLFGVGSTVGAFGIHNTTVFGPEIGFAGLGLNLVFAGVLWWFYRRGRSLQAVEATQLP